MDKPIPTDTDINIGSDTESYQYWYSPTSQLQQISQRYSYVPISDVSIRWTRLANLRVNIQGGCSHAHAHARACTHVDKAGSYIATQLCKSQSGQPCMATILVANDIYGNHLASVNCYRNDVHRLRECILNAIRKCIAHAICKNRYIYKYSFFPYVVSLWNKLPATIKEIQSLDTFKSRI